MARVRLRVDDFNPPDNPLHFLFDPRTGTVGPLSILRLTTTITVGSEVGVAALSCRPEYDAIIDTGAWVSLVKKEFWERLDAAGLVEHVERREADGTPIDGHTRIGGRRLRFTFGRIWMAVIDRGQSIPGVLPRRAARLPAVPVLCQLLQEDETVLKSPVLLGLHRGVLDGRQLRRVPVPAQPSPDDRYDVGLRFGQQWWLQDE